MEFFLTKKRPWNDRVCPREGTALEDYGAGDLVIATRTWRRYQVPSQRYLDVMAHATSKHFMSVKYCDLPKWTYDQGFKQWHPSLILWFQNVWNIFMSLCHLCSMFLVTAPCGWRVRVGVGSANNVPLHAYLLLRYWMFTCMCTRTWCLGLKNTLFQLPVWKRNPRRAEAEKRA